MFAGVQDFKLGTELWSKVCKLTLHWGWRAPGTHQSIASREVCSLQQEILCHFFRTCWLGKVAIMPAKHYFCTGCILWCQQLIEASLPGEQLDFRWIHSFNSAFESTLPKTSFQTNTPLAYISSFSSGDFGLLPAFWLLHLGERGIIFLKIWKRPLYPSVGSPVLTEEWC